MNNDNGCGDEEQEEHQEKFFFLLFFLKQGVKLEWTTIFFLSLSLSLVSRFLFPLVHSLGRSLALIERKREEGKRKDACC